MKRRRPLPDADQPLPVGADEARRGPLRTRPCVVPQRRVWGQSGDLPPQTHRPLPGSFPLLLLLAVRRLQEHRHLAVLLLLVLPAVAAHLPAQRAVRAAGGHRGVIEGRGVVWVRLAVLQALVGVRRLLLAGAFPCLMAEGALARVAVFPPSCSIRGEEGRAVRVSTVPGWMVLDRPVSSTVLSPHRAAGPALQTHRVTAVHPVSEASSLLMISKRGRPGLATVCKLY